MSYITWGEERCEVRDIWTLSGGYPVNNYSSIYGITTVGSKNAISFVGYGGGESGEFLKIADDGETVVIFGAWISNHYIDGSLYFYMFDEPLGPWEEYWKAYTYDDRETMVRAPANLRSVAEFNEIWEKNGLSPYSLSGNNFLEDWKSLTSNGPPFSTIKTGRVETPDKEINVRSAPGIDSEIIGKISDRRDVAIIEESDDWYAIKYRHQIGYISKEFVEIY